MKIGDKVTAQIGDGPEHTGAIVDVHKNKSRNEVAEIYFVRIESGEDIPEGGVTRPFTEGQLTLVSE